MPHPESDAAILGPDEEVPVQISGTGRSAFFLVCDHAGRRLPRALGSLGLSPAELETHIAWDLGAASVARRLAEALDGRLVEQRYSRLAIDCNRPLGVADSIVATSGGILVPGNAPLAPGEADRRARAIFHPYHDQIRSELDRRHTEGRPTVLVAMHSFTPSLWGADRPWHAGILYRDGRLAAPVLHLLRQERGLVIGDNEPYSAGELTDFTIVEHGERRGIPHVEIEIRQDLILEPAGQAEWAERFARILRQASGRLPA